METETLSNYDQKHLDNTMDVDIPQEEESVSPVNKTYEESSESTDVQNKDESKEKENENDVAKPSIELESDEECEEEEEEKLLLSPAHSDKAYDSDDGPLSPPLNRDLEESDNEGDKEDKIETNEEVEDKTETNIEEKEQELQTNEEEKEQELQAKDDEKEQELQTNKEEKEQEPQTNDEEKEQELKTNEEEKEEKVETNEEKEEKVETNEEDKNSSEKLQNNLDDSKNNEDDKNSKSNKCENNTIEDKPEAESEEIKESKKPDENIGTVDKNSEDKDNLDSKKVDTKQDKDKDVGEESSNDKVSNGDKQINIEETKKETVHDATQENKNSTNDNKEGTTELPSAAEDTHGKQDNGSEQNEHSLLKESLLVKPFDDGKEPEADEEMDMDEDFDPSLLCPELSMEVDEAPVITTNDAPAPETDGSKSPLHLYDPIFSTFVDEMTGAEVDFNLTAEELELKAKTYGPKNPVQYTKIHCTACNVHLGSAVNGQGNRFVHPLLKVLICKKCYHFYTSGEFEKDEDGSELYCRWCGQGGQVMCCSNCEMVFCKKCIRINFDRKKLSDIQKSDEWMCFKCNPSQLIHLRIHCAEFMEYVQAELRRASSSGDVNAFMNTDYCQCCLPQKKKAPAETATPTQSKKRKRNTGEEDPDYDPTKEKEEQPPAPVVTPSTSQQVTPSKPPILTPKVTPSSPQVRPNIIRPGLQTQVRPRILTPQANRPQQSFVKIMPGGVRIQGPAATNTPVRPTLVRQIRPSNTMKHEWFEKTVRAAARVNSNLSYTLTQLNRAQANATSVEGLAVVHNKLQEILSSSINSLIQIRKNLRTEFIAGIKNLRFPPKPTPVTPQPSTSKDDDDVIFVPSDPSPPCPPLVPVSNNMAANKIELPSSISLVKKSQSITTPSPLKAIPSTSGVTIKSPGSGLVAKKSTSAPDDNRPKGFLRVKSFSALQSVPSECITIPDDPIEEEPKKVEEIDPLDVSKDPLDVSKDPLEVTDDKTVINHTNGMTNGGVKEEDENSNKDGDTSILVGELKPAKIVLQRCQEIDDMVKTQFDVVNGEVTD